jgi:hypothetical protein
MDDFEIRLENDYQEHIKKSCEINYVNTRILKNHLTQGRTFLEFRNYYGDILKYEEIK